MNEIIEKARELGMMIAESDEFKALKGAEASSPDITKEDFEKIQTEMEEAFKKLMTNENIKRYIDANGKFKTLIDQVNSIIAYLVKGEEQAGSCSGNCQSCGGCN